MPNRPSFDSFWNRPALLAAAWSILLTAGCLLLVDPSWDDTDDVRMAMIASGTGAEPSPLLLYSSVLYGSVLVSLYHWLPSVAWYGWLQIVVLTLSQAALTFAGLSVRPRRPAATAMLAAQLAMMLYAWSHMQFSVTASLATTGGAALLLIILPSDETGTRSSRRVVEFACGWGLILIGSLIRFESCCLCLLLLTPIGALALLRARREQRHRHVIAAVGGICVTLACFAWNHAAYNDVELWRDFQTVRRPTAKIVNNLSLRVLLERHHSGTLDEDGEARMVSVKRALREVGWSINDLHCLMDWWYADPKVYRPGHLEKLESQLVHFSGDSPRAAVRQFLLVAGVTAGNNQFVLLAGLSLTVLLLTRPDRRVIATAVGSWCWLALVLWLILCAQKLPARVYVPAGFAGFVSTILACCAGTRRFDGQAERTQFQSSFLMRLGTACLTIAMLGTAFVVYEDVQQSRQMARERIVVMDAIDVLVRDDSFYVITVPFPFDRLSPLRPVDALADLRFVYFDGHQLSPRFAEVMLTNGVLDGGVPLLLRDDVRLVSSRPAVRDRIRIWFREHHDVDVTMIADHELDAGLAVSRVEARPVELQLDAE